MFTVREFQGADDQPLRYGYLSAADSIESASVEPESDRDQPSQAMIFIPGLGGSVKGALDFLERMQQGFHPIYGPDLRSFGLNPVDTPIHNAELILRDLDAFYDQVIRPAHPGPVTLCGISLGGVLAALLAARHPERYSRLVLLAPAFKPHPKSFSMGYTLRTTLAYLLKGPNARTVLPYGIEALTANESVLTDPQYAVKPRMELSPGFLLSVRSLCNLARAEVRRLKVPTMMVIPGSDVVCDPQAMREACRRIPADTPTLCREYPDFYHDVLFEENCPAMAREILDWCYSAISPATSLASK